MEGDWGRDRRRERGGGFVRVCFLYVCEGIFVGGVRFCEKQFSSWRVVNERCVNNYVGFHVVVDKDEHQLCSGAGHKRCGEGCGRE